MIFQLFPSQLLIRYENRMTTQLSALMRKLASEIDEAWSFEPLAMIAFQLSRSELRLSEIIRQSTSVLIGVGIEHILVSHQIKNDGVRSLLADIDFRLGPYSRNQAHIIASHIKDRIISQLSSGSLSLEEARRKVGLILNNKVAIDRIVRTTSQTALERGMWEAANSLGIAMTKEWVSREDRGVRPAHAAAHGQVRQINQSFDVGGEPMLHPGDPSASARNRVNCRCTTRYRIGGLPL